MLVYIQGDMQSQLAVEIGATTLPESVLKKLCGIVIVVTYPLLCAGAVLCV